MSEQKDERGHNGLTSVERLKEMMRPILLDWGHECTAALRAENARLSDALRQIISDFEWDYVLDGVVVDEPANTHRIAWILARSALAARASTPPDANTSWFCVPCGFTTRDAAEAQAHLGPHMIELTCPFCNGLKFCGHTQGYWRGFQLHLDHHAAQKEGGQ